MSTMKHAAVRVVSCVQSLGRIVSLLQLVCFIPLSLEHDKNAFLAFSASLAMMYFTLSTLRAVTTGTWRAQLCLLYTSPSPRNS